MFIAACAFALVGAACDQQKNESIKHMNLGVEHAATESYASAQHELETALNLDPTNHMAAYQLGQVYEKQKKWDKAADALSSAVKFNGSDPMYHYHLGHAYYEQAKMDMARPELEQAVKLNKRLFRAHWYLGRILLMKDDPKGAAAEWSESCKLNPTFGRPFVDLGKLYLQWDGYAEAASVLEQGSKYARDPEDLTNIFYYLGWAYEMQHQYDKAIEAYKNALEARKDNIDALLRLGMSYADKGDKANAIKNLQEFVKQGGGGSPMAAFYVQGANDRMLKLQSE